MIAQKNGTNLINMLHNCIYNKTLKLTYLYNSDEIAFSRCCLLGFYKKISFEEYIKTLCNCGIKKFIDEAICQNPEQYIKNHLANSCNDCNFGKGFEKEITNIVVDFEKTCNLNCFHCPVGDHSKNNLSYIAYFLTLHYLKNLKLKTISLTQTGEPFYYYDELIEFLSSLDGSYTENIEFTTNLTLLNEQRILKLKQISKKTKVNYIFNVSIDGISKETYEAIRIGANFDHVISNLKLLKNTFSDSNIRVSYVYKKPNFNEKNEDIISFFKEIGNFSVGITTDILDPSIEKAFRITDRNYLNGV